MIEPAAICRYAAIAGDDGWPAEISSRSRDVLKFSLAPARAFVARGEFLAGRGFAVVTTALGGTNSAVARVDPQDLETQVRNLEFAIARARQLPFVSGDRVGVLGFDPGTWRAFCLRCATLTSTRSRALIPGFCIYISRGLPQASQSYDAAALRVPWLRATSLLAMERPQDPGVKSLFDKAVHSNRYLVVTEEWITWTSRATARSAVGAFREIRNAVLQ